MHRPIDQLPYGAKTLEILAGMAFGGRCRLELDRRSQHAVSAVLRNRCIVLDPRRATLLHVIAAGTLLQSRSEVRRLRERSPGRRQTRRLWERACRTTADRFPMLGRADWNRVIADAPCIEWDRVELAPVEFDLDRLQAESREPLTTPASLRLDDLFDDGDPIAAILDAVSRGAIEPTRLDGLQDFGVVRVPVEVPTGAYVGMSEHDRDLVTDQIEQAARGIARCFTDKAEGREREPRFCRASTGARLAPEALTDAYVGWRTCTPSAPFERELEPLLAPYDPDAEYAVVVLDLAALSGFGAARMPTGVAASVLRALEILGVPATVLTTADLAVDERTFVQLVMRVKEADEPFGDAFWARLGRVVHWHPWGEVCEPHSFPAGHFDLGCGLLDREAAGLRRAGHLYYLGAADTCLGEHAEAHPERQAEWCQRRVERAASAGALESGVAALAEELREHVDSDSVLGRILM